MSTTAGTNTPSNSTLSSESSIPPSNRSSGSFDFTLNQPDYTPPSSPLPNNTSPPPSPTYMLRTVVPRFSGEADDPVQPGDFLKEFRNTMREARVTNDKDKIEAFGDYMKSNSLAEEWFADPNTPKTTWNNHQTAFTARFPGIAKAKKSGVELERDLLAMRLKIDNLGKTEKYGGEDVWTHVVFAEKALDLAKRAKIDAGSNSIWAVRDHLPDVIKDKLPEAQTDWASFCTAIKDVDLSHI